MKLNRIRIRIPRRRHEPLRGLDAVLAATNKSHHALGIESARIVDCLEEDGIQLVDFRRVSRIVAGRFVDGLERDQAGLARQLAADLVPETVELFLDHGQICAWLGDIRPDPGVWSC